MTGTLFIVPTPIGNLEDVTYRAIRVLNEVHTILAEDTRRTVKLCSRYSIKTPIRSFNEHSTEERVQKWIDKLLQGESLALVSDAGMPLVSDPGINLLAASRKSGVKIEVLPGASAVTTAVVYAGISGPFLFCGFPPRSQKQQIAYFEELRKNPWANIVFFDSPNRIRDTLKNLQSVFGDQQRITMCREMTKLHEEIRTESVIDLLTSAMEERGEFTLVIHASPDPSEESRIKHIDDLSPQTLQFLEQRVASDIESGKSTKEITQSLVKETAISRSECYDFVLQVRVKLP